MKIHTKNNPADVFTKPLSAEVSAKHFASMGFAAFGRKAAEDQRKGTKSHYTLRIQSLTEESTGEHGEEV